MTIQAFTIWLAKHILAGSSPFIFTKSKRLDSKEHVSYIVVYNVKPSGEIILDCRFLKTGEYK